MNLREQLLLELRQHNEAVQAEIKKLEDTISSESFAMSTVTGGPLAGTARSACQSRMQAASQKRDNLKKENAWVSEMLSKYK